MGNGRLPAAFARATLRGSDSIESDADGGEEDRAASVVEATSLHASNRARRLALGKKELCWIPCAAMLCPLGAQGGVWPKWFCTQKRACNAEHLRSVVTDAERDRLLVDFDPSRS